MDQITCRVCSSDLPSQDSACSNPACSSTMRTRAVRPTMPTMPAVPGEPAAASDASLPTDPAFLASYELIRKLGEGGMGAVYLMMQVKLKRKVAVKMVR